jgi:ribonucleotide reductase beta subunit family protein with ferritin-like domain
MSKRFKKDTEPILDPASGRLTTFPIQDEDAWGMYKRAQSLFWLPDEVKLSDDMKHWEGKLSGAEREFVATVLSFFASSDALVMENISVNFASEVQVFEMQAFYRFQNMIEDVHGETYSVMLETFVSEPTALQRHRLAIESHPFIARKAQWVRGWMDAESHPFRDRIVAFACLEGIFFSASFCAIFWLKKRGLMPGLCAANEFISRDEALHTEFACLVHSRLETPCARVEDILREAAELECEYVGSALNVDLVGLSCADMCEYVRFVTDRLGRALGLGKDIFGARNPFAWMSLMGAEKKTNFFERAVTEYKKAGVGEFGINEDLL